MKDYIWIIAEKVSFELDYSKKLKKLYDYNYTFLNEGSLTFCSENIREYINTMSIYSQESAESIKNEVIKPLEKVISMQLEEGSKLEKEHKKIERDYKDQISSLEKAKGKFLNLSMIAENATRDYELSKITPLNNNIEKNQKNCLSALKEVKDAEKYYLQQLTQTNNLRGFYIEENKRLLSTFEALDYCFSNICKESFQKFIVYTNAHISNQNFDIDKLKQSLNKIDVDSDLQEFIKVNKTELVLPPKHEYCEYNIKLQENPCIESNYPAEIVLKIISVIHDNFEMKASNWDYTEEVNKLKIGEMIKKVFNDSDIYDDERKLINSLLHNKKYRLFFLNSLNSYRIKGIFQIKEKNFEIMGEILKKILNCLSFEENENKDKMEYSELVTADKDYFEAAKYVIILSQTFKCKNESLQSKIEGEPILQTRQFWENMIQSKSKKYLILYLLF